MPLFAGSFAAAAQPLFPLDPLGWLLLLNPLVDRLPPDVSLGLVGGFVLNAPGDLVGGPVAGQAADDDLLDFGAIILRLQNAIS